MIHIGVVVQRYGNEVVGGAETLARHVAERLLRQGFRVTVFTTCAKDYLTWRNEYVSGESLLRGVTVRRFATVRERDIAAFNRFSDEFFAAPAGERDEKKWLAEQGPLCPGLIDALVAAEKEIDLFCFFTYLYYPTIEGIQAVKKPVILFPTAHDEPPIRLAAMGGVFRRVRALFFLTHAEKDLVERLFSPPGRRSLVRTGVDVLPGVDERLFRRRYSLIAPYLLYAGRIEKGKGLEAVFDHYRSVKNEAYVDLVLIGKKMMELPPIQGLKYLGFVSEQEKAAAFKGAVFSIQPSPLESLSITTLESFSQRTPVMVNRDCAALREHVELSDGGLLYGNREEFLAGFRRLYHRPALRAAMGEMGLAYVKKYYSWDVVMREIRTGIAEILGIKA